MKTFEMFGDVFYAHSTMPCSKVRGNVFRSIKAEDHQPHVWDSEHVIYGPYFCEGRNPTPPYQPKHRKDDE